MNVLFYLAGLVAVGSTAMVITRTNAMHALLYLITSLLSVAFIFLLLGAPFVAALEVIIYAGAVMVLFVFIVMLIRIGSKESTEQVDRLTPAMFVGPSAYGLILLAELGYVLYRDGATYVKSLGMVTPAELGLELFGPYLLAVEVAGLLLLAAMVGAFHLARQRKTGG